LQPFATRQVPVGESDAPNALDVPDPLGETPNAPFAFVFGLKARNVIARPLKAI
jgi:hypothetical protein